MSLPLANRTAKQAVFYLILLVLVGTSTLVLAEVLLRASGRVTTQSVHTASEEDARRIPGAFAPGQRIIDRSIPELAYRVTINSLGYRGREVEAAKAPGVTRVLCLGDSFTYGDYVDDDETFPSSLQALFDEKRMPVEVVNGGVGGTTITDQIHFMRKSMPLDPDVVILTFSENDIADLARYEPLHVSLARNRKLKSSLFIGSIYEHFRDTALFNFALRVRAKYEGVGRAENGAAAPSSGGEEHRLWAKYEHALQEMKAYLDARSIDLVFVIFPSHYRFGEPPDPEGVPADTLDHLRSLATALGIYTIDATEPLRRGYRLEGRRPEELYLLPYDGHPSKLAYSIVARTLFEALLERGIGTAA